MNWNNALSETEYLFIGLFILFYGFFLIRSFLVARSIGSPPKAIVLKFFLRAAYFGLLIISGLGLLFETEKEPIKQNNIKHDVFFLIDVSKSMNDSDTPPSRLEYTKVALFNGLESLKDNRLGLVIFSDDAIIHSPLTLDYEAFKLFLKSLNTDLLDDKKPIKDINKAFHLAIKKLKKSNLNKQVIVISDNTENLSLADSTKNSLKNIDIKTTWLYVDKAMNQNAFLPIFDKIQQVNNNQENKTYYKHIATQNDKYYLVLWLALIFAVLDILITVRVFKI